MNDNPQKSFKITETLIKAWFDYASLCSVYSTKGTKALLQVGPECMEIFSKRGADQGLQLENDFEMNLMIARLCWIFLYQQRNLEAGSLKLFFETTLPPTLFEISAWGMPINDQKEVVRAILQFGFTAVKNNMNRYKALIFYLPELYTRITLLGEKYFMKSESPQKTMLMRTLSVCSNQIVKGFDISLLLSDGLSSVFEIFDNALNYSQICNSNGELLEGEAGIEAQKKLMEGVLDCLDKIAEKYETNGVYTILMYLKFTFEFFKTNFEESSTKILFWNLIKKGERDEIRMLNSICSGEFKEEKYSKLQTFLLNHDSTIADPWRRPLSNREFEGLITLLHELIDLNVKKPHPTIAKLLSQTILSIESDLSNNKFSKERLKIHTSEISKISLFKILFSSQLDSLESLSPQEISAKLKQNFPQEVEKDSQIMETLQNIGKRLEGIDGCPQFMPVKIATIEAIQHFLGAQIEVGAKANPAVKLKSRIQSLNEYVSQLPKNVALRDHLKGVGYHPIFWDRDLYIQVQVEDAHNIDDNYRQSLINMFGEYVDILKGFNLKVVDLDGVETDLDKVFGCQDNLGFEDLKQRRGILSRKIDKIVENHPRKTFFTNRKWNLFAKENELDAKYQQDKLLEVNRVSQKKTYWARMNNTFLSTASCCSSNIVGCYAPNGDHGEKPLEIALKSNLVMISLFEENKLPGKEGTMGIEIENIEAMLTDQGLFIFKLYGNGHIYDTSFVWVEFFRALLTSNYVPGIILPRNFPNSRTFNLVNSFIQEEITTSDITVKDDFFADSGMVSYYDIKPPLKIKEGDIMLTEENVGSIQLARLDHEDSNLKLKTVLKNSTELVKMDTNKNNTKSVKPVKDIPGMLLMETIHSLTNDGNYKMDQQKVKVMGKYISKYIQKYYTEGIMDTDILTLGFDLDQWNRRHSNTESVTEAEKSNIIKKIARVVTDRFSKLYDSNLAELLKQNPNHFSDLKIHAETVIAASKKPVEKEKKRVGLQRSKSLADALIPDIPKREEKKVEEAWWKQYIPFMKKREEEEDSEKSTEFTVPKVIVKRLYRLLSDVRKIVDSNSNILRFSDLRLDFQEELMRWIFLNEDLVWRERGRRPDGENLTTFLNFIRPLKEENDSGEEEEERKVGHHGYSLDHFGYDPYPGMVILQNATAEQLSMIKKDTGSHLSPEKAKAVSKALIPNCVKAYAIGEFTSETEYEIVTAWVDKGTRGMDFAVQMYIRMMVDTYNMGCNTLYFDLLKDLGMQKMKASAPLFNVLMIPSIQNLIWNERKDSYQVENSKGQIEAFERVGMRLNLMRIVVKTFRNILKVASLFGYSNSKTKYLDFSEQPTFNVESDRRKQLDRKLPFPLRHPRWFSTLLFGITFLLFSQRKRLRNPLK